MKKLLLFILSLLFITPVFAEYFSCNLENTIQVNWNVIQNEDISITPYINIYYYDEDNQYISWQYLLSDLYLDWNFKKTYTWWSNNYWILTPVVYEEEIQQIYTPTFEITWNITEIDTWNVFNNFAENSMSVLLSNIPSYIQYVIIIMLFLFIIWIIRRFRR